MKIAFRKAMTKKIEDNIAALARRGEQLAAKRAKAQEALDSATSQRQQALLAGDLDDQRALDKLQVAVDSAKSALTGIDDALAILARQKAEAESALAAENDRVARAASADQLEKHITAIETAAGPWLEQSRIYADALSELAHMHFGADEMAKFLQSCMGQMETAANFQLAELKAMPQMIRDGRQAIPASKPTPASIVAVEPAPEMRRVFALRSVKWTDSKGQRQFGKQYTDLDLPPVLAQRGLREGALTTLDDDRRARLRDAHGGHGVNPDAVDVLDLDALEGWSGAGHASFDPVAQANFTTVDRGVPERKIAIEVVRT